MSTRIPTDPPQMGNPKLHRDGWSHTHPDGTDWVHQSNQPCTDVTTADWLRSAAQPKPPPAATLRVGVRRALPVENFGEAVGYVVGEMLDNIVSDSERAGLVPDWTQLFVRVTEEEAFPGCLVIRATTTCTVPSFTDLVNDAAKGRNSV